MGGVLFELFGKVLSVAVGDTVVASEKLGSSAHHTDVVAQLKAIGRFVSDVSLWLKGEPGRLVNFWIQDGQVFIDIPTRASLGTVAQQIPTSGNEFPIIVDALLNIPHGLSVVPRTSQVVVLYNRVMPNKDQIDERRPAAGKMNKVFLAVRTDQKERPKAWDISRRTEVNHEIRMIQHSFDDGDYDFVNKRCEVVLNDFRLRADVGRNS
jgi:hypothetical protein